MKSLLRGAEIMPVQLPFEQPFIQSFNHSETQTLHVVFALILDAFLYFVSN